MTFYCAIAGVCRHVPCTHGFCVAAVRPNPASSSDILLAYFVSRTRGIKLADVGLAKFYRACLRRDPHNTKDINCVELFVGGPQAEVGASGTRVNNRKWVALERIGWLVLKRTRNHYRRFAIACNNYYSRSRAQIRDVINMAA